MTVRKALFWTHLVAGVTAGVIVFIMSITGAALALQPQILLWAERDQRTVTPPSPDVEWLGPDALLTRVRDGQPNMVVTGLTLEHDRSLAAVVTLTKAEAPAGGPAAAQTTLWVNPYTGAVIGQLDATTPWRRFFRVSTDWHRWLAMNGENRPTGRWITGVSNAAFLVLALTGMYIWLPRVWSRAAVRAVGWFRSGLSGKARDFNWHNVLGAWSAPVLVVLTFTGMCISFPKTYDVIYSVTWMQRPPTPAPQAQPGPRSQAPREGGQRPDPISGGPREPSTEAPASPIFLDAVWPVAASHLPTWRSIAMRLPQRPGQPVTFTINDRERINPMARSTLTVDPVGARVVRWEPYEQLTGGQRLRTWMRFGHTGELWGIAGQVIAGLASAAGCVLVWTGLALAWRRFTAWRTRRRREEAVAIGEAA